MQGQEGLREHAMLWEQPCFVSVIRAVSPTSTSMSVSDRSEHRAYFWESVMVVLQPSIETPSTFRLNNKSLIDYLIVATLRIFLLGEFHKS